MAEWRVAEVVREARRLYYLRVDPKLMAKIHLVSFANLGQAPTHLGHLERMLLPRMEHIRFAGTDNLRNAGQPAKCRRIQNSVAITLERASLVATADTVTTPFALIAGPAQSWAKPL